MIWISFKKIYSILLFPVTCYFLFYFFFGSSGVLAFFYLRDEILVTENALEKVNDQKKQYILQLEKIKDINKIDLDMLEEQVRYITGYIGKRESEFVIDD